MLARPKLAAAAAKTLRKPPAIVSLDTISAIEAPVVVEVQSMPPFWRARVQRSARHISTASLRQSCATTLVRTQAAKFNKLFD